MSFSSCIFIFLFLPALFALYFAIPERFREARNNILLLFSLMFYAWGEPVFVFVMLLSITVNYVCGRVAVKRPRLGVTLASVIGLGLLVYYKYTGLLLSIANSVFGLSLPVPEIVLPIGISFFTFQGLSYVIDVARGDAPVQKNPLHVALYVSLFPQLIAGPIVRYQTVAAEIVQRHESLNEAAEGVRRFMIGLGKKMLLANTMGQIADRAFGLSAGELTWDIAWLGALAYTLQIYFDFSGYSDMAIGLGRVLGFHFLENFNYPYISRSITEFWRRWHISLSTWFRDYVYIPLGGNRCAGWKRMRNIFVVWFLTGLWHGANWTFILWGMWFFLLLMGEKFVWGKWLSAAPALLQHGYTMLAVVISWVLFRAVDLSHAHSYLGAMVGITSATAQSGQSIYYILQFLPEWILAFVACLPIKQWVQSSLWQNNKTGQLVLYYTSRIAALLLLMLSYSELVTGSFNPFIYFQF